MTTVDTIITRLQNEFDCRLTTEYILSIINNLEKRLAIDVVRKTRVRSYNIIPGQNSYTVDVNQDYITRIHVNDREIKKRYAYNSDGYICEGQFVVFSSSFEQGTLYVEYIVVPEEIKEADIRERTLFLGDGYDEIYIYHILSREALMSGDIEMLNNYSLIYAQALNSLKARLSNSPKGDEFYSDTQNCNDKYKNVW